jgi:prevent-host-death family protein
MKSLGLFEAKNRLSEVCAQVARTGEPCVITRHGRPLVQIVPVADAAVASVWDTVEEAQARYGAIIEELALPERNPASNRPAPL